jgi:heme exporter protein CcmD
MDHAPFILAAYAIAAVLLAWCALSPVLGGRKLIERLRRAYRETERDHAPKP